MGHKFQFVTLAGFHALNHSMFELARKYKNEDMLAYPELNRRNLQVNNMATVQHVTNVKAGYFGEVAQVIAEETASTRA